MILHYPDQALARLEEVSYLIKQDEDLSKYLKVEDVRQYFEVARANAEYIEKVAPQFATPQPEEEGEEVPAAEAVGEVQDLMADVRVF